MNHHYESPASEVLNQGRGIIQTHRPAFWLYALLLVMGTVLGFAGLGSALANFSMTVGLAFVGTFMFAALVLWLLLQLTDLDPKPTSIIAAAFLGGAFITTAVVQFSSATLENVFSKLATDPAVSGALSAATGEEYYKALIVVLIFLVAPWWWRRPLDGILFGALVGLGFQIFEDIVYVSGAASVNTGSMGALTLFLDRVVLAGFFSHPAWTAFFGLGFGYAVTAVSESKIKRIAAVVGGFALAWAAHAFWDLPVLGTLAAGGPLQVLLYTVLKSTPFLLILIPLILKAIKDEGAFFHRHAQPEVESAVLTTEDVARLETFGGRIKARREQKGHQAQFKLQHLMRSQLDLVRLHMHDFNDPDLLEEQRTFIEKLKSDE